MHLLHWFCTATFWQGMDSSADYDCIHQLIVTAADSDYIHQLIITAADSDCIHQLIITAADSDCIQLAYSSSQLLWTYMTLLSANDSWSKQR